MAERFELMPYTETGALKLMRVVFGEACTMKLSTLQSLTQWAVCVTCNERERIVLERYYGLVDGTAETLKAIGRRDELMVGPARVRQIRDKAVRKLRHPSKSRPLGAVLSFPDRSDNA